MKKRYLTKIIPVLTFVLIFLSNISYVHADGQSLWKKMTGQIDSFKAIGEEVQVNTENVVAPFVDLTQILTTIGAGVLVAVTTYMGIKYLTSGPEAQAKLKVQLIGLVVAGFVIFGAYFIWKVVLNFSNSIT